MFNEPIVDTTEDNITDIISMSVGDEEIYADIIYDSQKERYCFEIKTAVDGDEVCQSDPIFHTSIETRNWLSGQGVIDVIEAF